MKRVDIKKRLKEYRDQEFDFTAHVIRDKIRLGLVKKEDIEHNLRNPENLLRFQEEKHLNPNEAKYKLWFRLSRTKTLGVVVILNKSLKVVTGWEIITPWQKKLVKWKK